MKLRINLNRFLVELNRFIKVWFFLNLLPKPQPKPVFWYISIIIDFLFNVLNFIIKFVEQKSKT